MPEDLPLQKARKNQRRGGLVMGAGSRLRPAALARVNRLAAMMLIVLALEMLRRALV